MGMFDPVKDKASEKVYEFRDEAKSKLAEFRDRINDGLAQHPKTALVVAFIVAFVIGLIVASGHQPSAAAGGDYHPAYAASRGNG